MAIHSVLVVEDDRFIGEMYVRSLQHAGYEVDWVVDGNDGIVAAHNKPYDLILLDIMLPEVRGTDILRQLKKGDNPIAPTSRVIIMTNFDQDEDSRAAMEHDADGYLIKAEITPRKLLELIAQMQ
jgi:DNA-binding response OmpR family regulator